MTIRFQQKTFQTTAVQKLAILELRASRDLGSKTTIHCSPQSLFATLIYIRLRTISAIILCLAQVT